MIDSTQSPERQAAWRVYLQPRVVSMAFLGFAAGLPYILVGNTLSYWLKDAGVDIAVIGFFSWVGMAHSIKVLWAPVVDRLPLPGLSAWLGKRRAWILAAQLTIGASLLGMALIDPANHLAITAALVAITAFGSATQDIAIDAYRVEAAMPEHQGAMAATYVAGYRTAMLMGGSGALYIADFIRWDIAYTVMAGLMGVGVVTILAVREPDAGPLRRTAVFEQRVLDYLNRTTATGWRRDAIAWLIGAVLCPLGDFFYRYGKAALAILAFIGTFKISDLFMGTMSSPFYDDLGFTKTEVATVSSGFGLAMTLIGAGLGGLLVVRFRLARMLILMAVMAPVTNLVFAWVASIGPQIYGLVIAIIADNTTNGLATAVLLAYLASLVNTEYTAMQYALFTSLMSLPGQFLGGFTGIVASHLGWQAFFGISALIGLPALALAIALLWLAHPDHSERSGTVADYGE